MFLLSAEEMRRAEAAAGNDYLIQSLILMENAGRALAEEAAAMLKEKHGAKTVILCGGGNNGGDGFAAARHLHNKGFNIKVYTLQPAEKFKGDALYNLRIINRMGIETQHISDEKRLKILKVVLAQSDLIIDCIFGTGLNGNVRGLALSLIDIINESGRRVLACDIPSGLCADSGIPLGNAVKAAKTVSFAYGKIGLFLPPAEEYAGQIKIADISLPREIESSILPKTELIDEDFCRRWLVLREKQSHKGNFGHLLMLAGSYRMPGAALMAAMGALRSGVGLFSAAVPSSLRMAFCGALPEAMYVDLPENEEGFFTEDAAAKAASFPADAFLIGPGMGKAAPTLKFIRSVLPKLNKNAVIDGDALNALAGHEALFSAAGRTHILTPHPGEMARLCGLKIADIQKKRVQTALDYAVASKTVVVLKGAGAVVAEPGGRVYLSTAGNPGMATGGSGDVLAGIIASLLAQGLPSVIAAACGAWLHGIAGDLAAKEKSRLSMLPTDICRYLGKAHRLINENL
jgi:NAD(P)H-hydrate epimerase